MPLLHDDALPRGPRVIVHASIAVELEWALASSERVDYRRDHAALVTLYDQSPQLGERVRSFWGPDVAMSCGGFMELMALAHHGGLLLSTDARSLLGRLEDLCASPPRDLKLGSETDEDRAAILCRLDQLQSSLDLRRRYVQLLTDVWGSLNAVWERHGRLAVDAAVAARCDLLANGASWTDVARSDCDWSGLLTRLVENLGPNDMIAVIPAFFTHRGLVVELPGLVVVGVRTDPSGAQARARTELLARRLKTISDPTRLAILDALSDGPRTVTEIAASFGLAQPTVSNHIKQLRDAGLVKNDHNGTRRDLLVQPDAIAELLGHLQSVLRQPAAVLDSDN
ncbi:MAG: metalloregulator ArsR/SmtB family transcription factor [Actinomycetota bacterium]|nr:metalloregulator ArsR/SmtB family transcription factor [Actinomycetota bacterium]